MRLAIFFFMVIRNFNYFSCQMSVHVLAYYSEGLFFFYLSLMVIAPFNKLLQCAGHGAKCFAYIISNHFRVIITYIIFIIFI